MSSLVKVHSICCAAFPTSKWSSTAIQRKITMAREWGEWTYFLCFPLISSIFGNSPGSLLQNSIAWAILFLCYLSESGRTMQLSKHAKLQSLDFLCYCYLLKYNFVSAK